MIAINLLPKELRKSERKIILPYKAYFAGAVLILMALHLFLFFALVSKRIQVAALKKTWNRVEPGSKDAASIRREMKEKEASVAAFTKTLTRQASLTEILSSLSAAVPKGMWLERFSFSGGEGRLVIQGSVVSLAQNEMTLIGKFLQDIRSGRAFSSLFAKIELNSVQRRTIKTYDVVDFVFLGEMKK